MSDALKGQVGGNHYVKLAIQPTQMAMRNNWDACAHNILKYVTRHEDKHGRMDIEKAMHYVELRHQLLSDHPGDDMTQSGPHILMQTYVALNRIPLAEATALYALEAWIYGGTQRSRHELMIALGILLNRYSPDGVYDRRGPVLPEGAVTKMTPRWPGDCFKDAQYPNPAAGGGEL